MFQRLTSKFFLSLVVCSWFVLVVQCETRNFLVSLLVCTSFRSFSLSQQQFCGAGCREARLQLSCLRELSRFVYCLLHKMNTNRLLPLLEKWETYMLSNHSAFPVFEEEPFIEGTRVLAAFEKVSSFCLKSNSCKHSRQFLEHHVRNVLSSVTARSFIG